MDNSLAPPDILPLQIPASAPDRKSAPERLETPCQNPLPTQQITQELEIQEPPSHSPESEQETTQQLSLQDPEPQTYEEQLTSYIQALQNKHTQELSFFQKDLHLEKSKRVHLIQEQNQERSALQSKIRDLTIQLYTTQTKIPGTFENKCSILEKLRTQFPEIRTEELAILICETYSTIDLLNLVNFEGKGSSSEPVEKKRYGGDERVWSRVFLKYIEILGCIYSRTYPELMGTVLKFHREILGLSERYNWKEQVLPLALFCHGMVRRKSVTKVENWAIPEGTRNKFCPEKKKERDGKVDWEGEQEREDECVRGKERLREFSNKFKDNDMLKGYTSLKERYGGPKLGSVFWGGEGE